MTTHYEEDTPSANLVNREVVRLLATYLLRYKRYLLHAGIFVIFITAARLIVPWISGFVVDRYLVKTGFTVNIAASHAREGGSIDLERAMRHGIALDSATVFLFRHDLGRFSATEIARLKSEGVLSSTEYLLVRATAPQPALQQAIEKGKRIGSIRRYGSGACLFSDNAAQLFTAREMIRLRRGDWDHVVLAVLAVVALPGPVPRLIPADYRAHEAVAIRHARLAARPLYRHLLSLELSYFDKNPVGRLVNRVSNDIETLNEMFSSVAVAVFQDLLIMLGIVVVMFATDAKLALAVSVMFPFLAIITVVFRDQARSAYRMLRTRVAHLNAFLNENITGMRIIQIFGREQAQFTKFDTINHGVLLPQHPPAHGIRGIPAAHRFLPLGRGRGRDPDRRAGAHARHRVIRRHRHVPRLYREPLRAARRPGGKIRHHAERQCRG